MRLSFLHTYLVTNYEIGRRVGIAGRGGCVTGCMWVVVARGCSDPMCGGQCVWCGPGRLCVSEGAFSVPVPDLVPEGNQGVFRVTKKVK